MISLLCFIPCQSDVPNVDSSYVRDLPSRLFLSWPAEKLLTCLVPSRTGTNPMKGPRALVHHMVQTMRQNELVIHPTYVALTLILVILFAWNYIHPSGIPWKPDGVRSTF